MTIHMLQPSYADDLKVTIESGAARCCCRNEIEEAIETCLAAVIIIIIFAGALVPLWGQSRPASSSSDSDVVQPHKNAVTMLAGDLKDYEISPDDLLDVYVFDIAELSRQYRVSPNGSIQLPLLSDSIAAAGLTPSQLSDLISERLRASRLIADPKVTVEVKESRVHSVAITGAVKKPQIYAVFGQTTLLDLFSQAEGLADDAASTAIITRGEVARRRLGLKEQGGDSQQLGGITSLKVDLKQLLETEDTGVNPVIYPGDRVTVPHAGIFYVLGAVTRPGGYNLRDAQEQITVLTALATAGGITPTAKNQKAVLIRKNAQAPSGREEINLNLKEIVSGHVPDLKIKAEDVLYIPESGGKKAGRAVLSALGAITTTTTSGVIVYRR